MALLKFRDPKAEAVKRAGLLQHYQSKPPTVFYQYDGHLVRGRDDVMRPDGDGDAIMASVTCELMHGPKGVRVLIPTDTTEQDAARLLRKIADTLESGAFAALEERPF